MCVFLQECGRLQKVAVFIPVVTVVRQLLFLKVEKQLRNSFGHRWMNFLKKKRERKIDDGVGWG